MTTIIHPFDPRTEESQMKNTGSLEGNGGFQLQQWPVKLWKIPATSPYFHHAHLLILSDCAAIAYKNLPQTLVGRLPLLCCLENDFDVSLKLTEILRNNDIKSITVVRMDAPCCADLTDLVMQANRQSRKNVPIRATTAFIDCEIVE